MSRTLMKDLHVQRLQGYKNFHLDLEKIKQNKQKTWCTICTLYMRWPVTSRKQKSKFRKPRVTQQESAVTYSVMEKL